MKYDFLIEKYLKEAIGDVLGNVANIGATSIKNQQGTVFDTLAKPNKEPEKDLNCLNTNTAKDNTWESKLGIGKLIYVRFADPASTKDKKQKQKLNTEDLPYIEVELKIQKLLGNGMFYATIQDTERYYSKIVQSPTTGKTFSKIDIRTPNINVNQNSFTVLMGRGTMEPNFCFAKTNRPSKI